MAGNKGAQKAASCSHPKTIIGDWDRFVKTTESMRAEEELRASEEKYRTIVENSNEGILVIDQDFNVTFSNQKFADMVGYTVEELLSGNLFKFIDRESIDLVYTNLEKRRAGIALMSDFKLRHKNGSVIWVISKTSPLFDRNCSYTGAVCFVTDISERMRVEKALRESESSLALAQKIAHLGSWERDLKTNEMKWSEEAYNLYGLKSGEYIPDYKSFISFVHPEDREIPRRSSNVALDEGKQYSADYRIVRADGTIRFVHAESNIIIKDENGIPIKMFGTIQDITDRKFTEHVLCESEERLQLCAATAQMGMFDWDILNDRHVWSPETYKIYGLPPDMPLSLDYMMGAIYPGDRQDAILAAGLDPAGPGEYSMEYRIFRASDGAIRWIYVKARVFFAGEGADRRAVRVLGAIQDITERKLAEEALSDAKTRAELYLDLMGHDINNMHQIALGYLELARDTYMDAGQQEFLDKSIEVLQRSTRLIKNVSKLQKLQEGVLQKWIMDLCPVLADIQREYGAIPAKPIILNFNGYTHCDVWANELLNDVFSNLVTNAIKHTGDRANISIILENVKENDCYYYRVSVEDNGPGIPDNFKGVIFNRMLKGTKKAKGMGLGLYLVKSLVDSYSGRVWVEDRVPGDHMKGAKFVVMLPAADQKP